jgi:hypothetical protein
VRRHHGPHLRHGRPHKGIVAVLEVHWVYGRCSASGLDRADRKGTHGGGWLSLEAHALAANALCRSYCSAAMLFLARGYWASWACPHTRVFLRVLAPTPAGRLCETSRSTPLVVITTGTAGGLCVKALLAVAFSGRVLQLLQKTEVEEVPRKKCTFLPVLEVQTRQTVREIVHRVRVHGRYVQACSGSAHGRRARVGTGVHRPQGGGTR